MPLLLRLGRLLVAAALACSLFACGSGEGSAARTSDTRSDLGTDARSDASTDLGSDDESDLQSDLESDFDSDSTSDVTSDEPEAGSDFTSFSSTPSANNFFGTYVVTIEGTISGRSFRRSAQLDVVPTITEVPSDNDVNALDFCLSSGNPIAAPDIGAIRWGTSAGCLSGTSVGFDLAFVNVSGDTVVAQPDPNAGSVSTAGFNATSGVVAQIYQVTGRSIELQFSGTTVSGTIALDGFCGLCTGAVGGNGAFYSATLSGS